MTFELTVQDVRRITNKLEVFRVLESITGIPFLVLISLWGAFDGFKLKPIDKSKGFYNLPLNMSEDELCAALYSFNRLNINEVKMLCKKGPGNLICGTLVMAADIKKKSSRGLYPEQNEKILLQAIKAYNPSAPAIYDALKKEFKGL